MNRGIFILRSLLKFPRKMDSVFARISHQPLCLKEISVLYFAVDRADFLHRQRSSILTYHLEQIIYANRRSSFTENISRPHWLLACISMQTYRLNGWVWLRWHIQYLWETIISTHKGMKRLQSLFYIACKFQSFVLLALGARSWAPTNRWSKIITGQWPVPWY